MQSNYPARRKEFIQEDRDVVDSILQQARFGTLATMDASGLPEVRPLNFVAFDDALYFHTSPKGALQERAGIACFSAQDRLGWIPSYWRHPEMACPATTYYRSVVIRGKLLRVESVAEKGRVLQAFMDRYQSEGRFVGILDDLERYRGSLEALAVFRLPMQDVSCKVKFGQHLNDDQRSRIYRNLLLRGQSGDLIVAREMLLYNPHLQGRGKRWTENPLEVDAEQVFQLLQSTYWGHRRTRALVTEHLEQAAVVMALVDGSRLLAYARINRVDGRTGFLYDVIVDPDFRGQGLGKELMVKVMEHSRTRDMERIFLDTRDAMPLYERYGFERVHKAPTTGSWTMVRYAPAG